MMQAHALRGFWQRRNIAIQRSRHARRLRRDTFIGGDGALFRAALTYEYRRTPPMAITQKFKVLTPADCL